MSTYRELWATVNSHLTSAFVVSEGGLELTPSRFSRVLPRPAIRALTSAFPFVRGTPVSSGTAFYCTVRCNRLASGPDRCANTCRGLDRSPAKTLVWLFIGGALERFNKAVTHASGVGHWPVTRRARSVTPVRVRGISTAD